MIMWLSKIAEKISVALHITKGDLNKNAIKSQVLDNSQQSNTQVHTVENLQINQGRPQIEEKMLAIIEKVVDQNQLLIFQDIAKGKVVQRNEEFKTLIEAQTSKLSPDELTKLEEPDAQAIVSEASRINARTPDSDLRKILANLVIKRVKDDTKGQEELKNIVYNEAIRTIAKITNNQLKIITLNYLLNQTISGGILNWEKFNEYLNTNIKPLLDFRNTDSEFQHLIYAGLASISSFGSWDILSIIRQTYSFLFLTPITEEELKSINLPESLSKNLIEAFTSGSFTLKNKADLEKILNSVPIDQEIKTKLLNLYQNHILPMEEAEAMIKEKTDIGKELLKIYGESPLSRMRLTSVGVAIAIANFEQTSGHPLNIDLWIN